MAGLGTTWLFNEANVGTALTLRGPQGVFILPENIDRDLFFICTGTGIAPFRSMIHHIHKQQVPHQNIYIIFGTRQIADSLYRQEMTDFQKNFPNFTTSQPIHGKSR